MGAQRRERTTAATTATVTKSGSVNDSSGVGGEGSIDEGTARCEREGPVRSKGKGPLSAQVSDNAVGLISDGVEHQPRR